MNLPYDIVQYMCIVESLKSKRYGYMGLTSALPIDVQTSSLVINFMRIRVKLFLMLNWIMWSIRISTVVNCHIDLHVQNVTTPLSHKAIWRWSTFESSPISRPCSQGGKGSGVGYTCTSSAFLGLFLNSDTPIRFAPCGLHMIIVWLSCDNVPYKTIAARVQFVRRKKRSMCTREQGLGMRLYLRADSVCSSLLWLVINQSMIQLPRQRSTDSFTDSLASSLILSNAFAWSVFDSPMSLQLVQYIIHYMYIPLRHCCISKIFYFATMSQWGYNALQWSIAGNIGGN